MIDIKLLRENPKKYIDGAAAKNIPVDIQALLELDEQRRALTREREDIRAEQKRISKEIGPQIGKLKGELNAADEESRAEIETQLSGLEEKPSSLKAAIKKLDDSITAIEPEWNALLLQVPQPPDSDVPVGISADDNVQLRTWAPDGYDLAVSFADNRGFKPKTHMELVESLGLVDFQRGVKMAGTRHYVLTGNESIGKFRCIKRYVRVDGDIDSGLTS